MWLISFLPDMFFHILLGASILVFLISSLFNNVPFLGGYLGGYTKLIQIISVVCLVFAVWSEGGIAKDNEYKEKIKALQQKISEAEVASDNLNNKLFEEMLKQQQEIKRITDTNKSRMRAQAAPLDLHCMVSQNVINILNDATRNRDGSKK
jgi:hypothetical protein